MVSPAASRPRARLDAARRCARERRGAERAAREAVEDRTRAETVELLHEELARLPEADRAVIVLCDLEGLTHEQAAHQLQGSVRTVQRRLERGRRRLRSRLAPRLRTQVGALMGGAEALAASTPRFEATAWAAVWFAANPGSIDAGTVPASIVSLAEGVLKTMTLNALKLTAIACFSAGLIAVGIATQIQGAVGVDPPIPSSPPPPAAAATPARVEKPRELARDNDRPAGKKSLAGSAHAVRFESPGDDWLLTSVRLHGARYGYPQAPDEDFKVFLCDDDFHEIASFPFPYSTFKRGAEQWVDLALKPTRVPARFIVCVGFNPTGTKGVYVSHDGRKPKDGDGTSLTGLPGGRPSPFTQGNWLIRARVEPPALQGEGKAKEKVTAGSTRQPSGSVPNEVQIEKETGRTETQTREEHPHGDTTGPGGEPPEALRFDLEFLTAQLAKRQAEVARWKAQHQVALAIVATNTRLNQRRPGMVSIEEIRKSESEVKVALAQIQVAEAESQEVAIRLEYAKRAKADPERLKEYLALSGRVDNQGLVRRMERLEQKLNELLKAPSPRRGEAAPRPEAESKP